MFFAVRTIDIGRKEKEKRKKRERKEKEKRKKGERYWEVPNSRHLKATL
jgi:hypothetical protein